MEEKRTVPDPNSYTNACPRWQGQPVARASRPLSLEDTAAALACPARTALADGFTESCV